MSSPNRLISLLAAIVFSIPISPARAAQPAPPYPSGPGVQQIWVQTMLNLLYTGSGGILQANSSGQVTAINLVTVAQNGQITLLGAEGSQLEWLLGGQAWKASIQSNGNWYILDSTNSKFPLTLDKNATASVTVGSSVAVAGGLTYGGVTLANSVTGTGSMVLSVSPTFTGSPIIPGLPNLTANVESSGLPGLDGGQWFIFNNVTTAPTGQSYTLRTQRNASYTGGSGTFGAAWSACTTAAGETDLIYCGLDTLDNFETGGGTSVGVARYSQAFKEASSGATWASVSELRDYSSNSTSSAVTVEVDAFAANVNDSHGNRIAMDIVAGLIPGQSGYTPVITDLIRVGAQNGGASQGEIVRGLSFQQATWLTLIGSEGTVAAVTGLDLHAISFSGPAIALAATQTLAVDCTGPASCTREWLYASGEETYHTPNGNVFNISDTGVLNFATLPSGTPATYACFTSTGSLVSSVSAC